MKKLQLILTASLFIFTAHAGVLPAAFKWPANGAQNQHEQGPCHIFATASNVTSWLQMLYTTGTGIGISTGHLYSNCAGANPGGSTDILGAMNFLKFHGAVDQNCVPYSNTNPCTLPKYLGSTLQYISVQIDANRAGGNGLINNDCETPWCSCMVNGSKPTIRYRIGDVVEIRIGDLANSDALKQALINDGPISFWMKDQSLHGNFPHAYTLYGWDAAGNWLLMDSWPDWGGYTTTTLDLVSIFHNPNNQAFKAYYIKNSATAPAVYVQNYNGTAWSTLTSTPDKIIDDDAFITTLSVSGPSSVTTSGGAVYTINNLSLITGATVTWTSEPVTFGASIVLTPTSGTTATGTAGSTGTAKVVAIVQWPNGIRLKVRSGVVNVTGANIPFTLTNTVNNCLGTSRNITYQASSTYSGLSCTWTFSPQAGSNYSKTINGCTFNVVFSNPLPKGFGLTVAVTASSLPGAHDGGTAGGSALPCGTGPFASAGGASLSVLNDESVSNDISVSPNPSSSSITVRLPSTQSYIVKLINMDGKIMLTTQATNSTIIDLNKMANGVYVVQVTGRTDGIISTKKVIVQK